MKSKKTKQIFLPLLLVVVMMFSLVGCDSAEDHIGEAKTPSGSGAMKGQQYSDVVEDFEEKGFTNIKLDKLEDLVTGWMTKEGEVEKVSVGGDENYDPDKWVANDVAVVITYHAFPEKEESPESEKSESSDSKSDNNSSENLDVPEKTETLTISNCEDLQNLLLLESTSDASIAEFASKYKGHIIEFDGHIAYIDKHENAKTRYDILIYTGDYRETELTGPHFKFEDVGVYDLGIKDLYLPDYVDINHNVQITAEVKEFNTATELFMLDPVSIVDRENNQSFESKAKSSDELPVASSDLSNNSSKEVVPPIQKPETSVVSDNERKVYWADTGTKIHTSAGCRTIKGNVNSGTEADAITAGRTEGYCKVCG